MDVSAASLSDVGQVRERNEDSCFAGARVFAVADGLGGHTAGEVASNLALDPLRALDEKPAKEVYAKLAEAVRKGNRAVFERADADPSLKGMGTTMTAVALHDGSLHLAHVGDSRCYLLRDGAITQVSRDHTLVARMVEEGKLTQEQAESHPQRSILTRALGADRDVSVEETQVGLLPGDAVLLCSDGLTAVLGDQDIVRLVGMETEPEQICRVLVDEANARGGPDNVTVVYVSVTGDFRPPPEVAVHKRDRARAAGTRRFPVRLSIWVLVLVLLIGGGYFGLKKWTADSWYVGVDGTTVAIFEGLPVEVAGFSLSHVEERTDLAITQVSTPSISRALEAGIRVATLAAARVKVQDIKAASGIEEP